MAEKTIVQDSITDSDVAIAKAKDFWSRNGKLVLGIGTALLVLVGGFYIYKHFFQAPKEEKAADAMFKAEDYYRRDSLTLALNGDGQNVGFLSVISKYGGTDAANLAHFYAGSIYLKLDDNKNAVKYLKDFSSTSKQVQQRAYKLLGDAYADLGQNSDALDSYKKAAHHFEADKMASSDALFLAAYFSDRVVKDQKQAIELFKELKSKYPQTQQGQNADKYLAQLGVYNAD